MAVFDGHCDPEPVNYLEAQLVPRLAQHVSLMLNPLGVMAESTYWLI